MVKRRNWRGAALALSVGLALLAGCAPTQAPEVSRAAPPLYPHETAELRGLVNKYADHYEVPRSLVHRVIQRESDYRPHARNGPYYGMMQILPATARTMGFRGSDSDLLDAETNLQYALKYLKGAYMVADGDWDDSIMWYAKGYYYEAKRKGLLVETGLRSN